MYDMFLLVSNDIECYR